MDDRIPFLGERRLPTFDQWLDKHGDGERAEGFEVWSDLEDFVARTLEMDAKTFTDEELSFFRMWKGFGVAIVELCNIEHKHGRKPEQIMQTMPRVIGGMAMYAAASTMREDTPWREIAKLMFEEMRYGCKFAADELSKQYDREDS